MGEEVGEGRSCLTRTALGLSNIVTAGVSSESTHARMKNMTNAEEDSELLSDVSDTNKNVD